MHHYITAIFLLLVTQLAQSQENESGPETEQAPLQKPIVREIKIFDQEYIEIKADEDQSILVKTRGPKTPSAEESPTPDNRRDRMSIGSIIFRGGYETRNETQVPLVDPEYKNSTGDALSIEIGPNFRFPIKGLRAASFGWVKSWYLPFGVCPPPPERFMREEGQVVDFTNTCSNEKAFKNFFIHNWTALADYDVLVFGTNKTNILSAGVYYSNRSGDRLNINNQYESRIYMKGGALVRYSKVIEEGDYYNLARTIDLSVYVGDKRTFKILVGSEMPFMGRKRNPPVKVEK